MFLWVWRQQNKRLQSWGRGSVKQMHVDRFVSTSGPMWGCAQVLHLVWKGNELATTYNTHQQFSNNTKHAQTICTYGCAIHYCNRLWCMLHNSATNKKGRGYCRLSQLLLCHLHYSSQWGIFRPFHNHRNYSSQQRQSQLIPWKSTYGDSMVTLNIGTIQVDSYASNRDFAHQFMITWWMP